MEINTITNQKNVSPKYPTNPAQNTKPQGNDHSLPTITMKDPRPADQLPPRPKGYTLPPLYDPYPPLPSSQNTRKRALTADSTHSEDETSTARDNSNVWMMQLGSRGNRFAPIFKDAPTTGTPDNIDTEMRDQRDNEDTPSNPTPPTTPIIDQGQQMGPNANRPPPQTGLTRTTTNVSKDKGKAKDSTQIQTRNSAVTSPTATGPLPPIKPAMNVPPHNKAATGAPPSHKPVTNAPPPQGPTPPKQASALDQLLDEDEEDDRQTASLANQHDDALEYTPMPKEGWPPILYTSVKSPFRNISQTQLAKWRDEITGGKCLAQIMYYSTGKGDENKRVEQIKEILDRTMGIRNVKVAPPTPKIPHGQAKGHPFSFLLWGIPLETAERLILQHCIATKIAGLIFLPFEVAYPAYLGSLDHLQARDDQDLAILRKEIIGTWKDPKKNDVLRTISQTIADTEEDIVDPNAPAIAHEIVDSLQLEGLIVTAKNGSSNRHIINLYIDPKTNIEKKWLAIRKAVANTDYATALYGKGIYFEGWGSCHACHGEDHPVSACPYRTIEGWIQSTQDRRAGQTQWEDQANPDEHDKPRYKGREPDPKRPQGPDGRRGAPRGRLT